MWPDSKGKGGKDGSPKSKDGGGEVTKTNAGASGSSSGGKGGGKGRNTRTKMKAISAETLATAAEAQAAAAKLEQDIIKAAQNLSHGQGQSEETKTLIEVNRVPDSMVRAEPPVHYNNHSAASSPEPGASANLMRLPDSNASSESMDDKISGLWKSRVLGAYRANPRASQHILPAMKNNTGSLEVTEKAKAAAQHDAMINVVDKMFDVFQNLAFEFNNVARASNLELTWIRPVISKENISSWHQSAQIVSVFTGRISTRYWTMVVRGTLDSVLAYVIPADKLLSFSNQPAHFQPVIELIPIADGLAVRWHTMNTAVTADELTGIYRALLDNMIRIAQDDAPCDCLIDLPAYGVYLSGLAGVLNQPVASAMPAGTPPGMSPLMSSGQFQNPASEAPYPPPFAPGAAPAAGSAPAPADDDDGWKSADETWKAVVRSVRGANPPAGASAGAAGSEDSAGSQDGGRWKTEPLPSTLGFNQDEPWKYAAPSSSGISGSGQFGGAPSSSSFGSGGSGGGQFSGDRDDEPPLPKLPDHLFEGLPPRPQVAKAGGAASPSSAVSQPAIPPSPSPWGAPPLASAAAPTPASNPISAPLSAHVPNATSASTNYSSVPIYKPTDSSDGWKSADVGKANSAGLPPLPVPAYNPQLGTSFMSEPAPLANPIVSPESFTSGSIRVDAIAREIAHMPVLPPAVPGFEPYKVDEPGVGAASQTNAFIMDEPDDPVATSTAQANATVLGFADGAGSDREIAALFEGDPVNAAGSARAAGDGFAQFRENGSANLSASSGSGSGTGSGFSSSSSSNFNSNASANPNVIGFLDFGKPRADDLPWPPGVKDQAALEAELEMEMEAEAEDGNAFIASVGQAPSASSASAAAQGGPDGFVFQERSSQSELPTLPAGSLNNHAGSVADPFTSNQFTSYGEGNNVPEPAGHASGQAYPTGGETGGHLESAAASAVPPAMVPTPIPAPSASPLSNPVDSRAAIREGFRQALQVTQSPIPLSSVPGVTPVAAPGNLLAAPPASYMPGVPVGAEAGARSLRADLAQFLATIDSELETISDRGSEAFSRRDLKGAEKLIKLAETLSELKDSIVKFRDENGAELS
ncbi:MAG: hypothetical protein KGS72_12160 [Cyanobacteria bacterium REEB67]|nr:hypothetical protein [Cyanobacteria bacterium REEB67]